ncbi:MAG: winged helix-turn-helix transcriptional regulator [Chloroflexi bacterium]|nr:winged helix-turn-helix transcriptional regulator [Chloroflexota bacterium]MBV9597022.1 winged helix-turn-helix transcriptional regulator [Chloroflexota bacterium]
MFKALADPTRVQMLHMLKTSLQPICVCDFVITFGLAQPTISHHLGKLKHMGFVESGKRGACTFYALQPRARETNEAVLALIP